MHLPAPSFELTAPSPRSDRARPRARTQAPRRLPPPRPPRPQARGSPARPEPSPRPQPARRAFLPGRAPGGGDRLPLSRRPLGAPGLRRPPRAAERRVDLETLPLETPWGSQQTPGSRGHPISSGQGPQQRPLPPPRRKRGVRSGAHTGQLGTRSERPEAPRHVGSGLGARPGPRSRVVLCFHRRQQRGFAGTVRKAVSGPPPPPSGRASGRGPFASQHGGRGRCGVLLAGCFCV